VKRRDGGMKRALLFAIGMLLGMMIASSCFGQEKQIPGRAVYLMPPFTPTRMNAVELDQVHQAELVIFHSMRDPDMRLLLDGAAPYQVRLVHFPHDRAIPWEKQPEWRQETDTLLIFEVALSWLATKGDWWAKDARGERIKPQGLYQDQEEKRIILWTPDRTKAYLRLVHKIDVNRGYGGYGGLVAHGFHLEWGPYTVAGFGRFWDADLMTQEQREEWEAGQRFFYRFTRGFTVNNELAFTCQRASRWAVPEDDIRYQWDACKWEGWRKNLIENVWWEHAKMGVLLTHERLRGPFKDRIPMWIEADNLPKTGYMEQMNQVATVAALVDGCVLGEWRDSGYHNGIPLWVKWARVTRAVDEWWDFESDTGQRLYARDFVKVWGRRVERRSTYTRVFNPGGFTRWRGLPVRAGGTLWARVTP
jgi:hypothetical protein